MAHTTETTGQYITRLKLERMELKSEIIRLRLDIVELGQQRHDLLEVCKAFDAYWTSGNFSRRKDLWDQLRAAIAKAEGKNR